MQTAEDCQIRRMRRTDLPRVLAWRNHAEVRRFMLSQHEISPSEHRQWYEINAKNPQRALLIVEDEDGALGFVQFKEVDFGASSDWGFYLAPDMPRGAGRRLGIAALNFAFRSLGLHKVCGQALAFNKASINFHRKLGFQQEGLLRQQHRIDGIYCDLIYFGLLRDEWLSQEMKETYG